jgi:predicted ATPase
LAHAGRIAEALAVAEEGIKQSETGWLPPELLRVKGELLLLQSNRTTTETAEDFFRQVLDAARQHKALSSELRAATSLARLLRNQNRPADTIACLKPVYDRFTEGCGTADLTTAKRLLDELSETWHR